MKKDKKSLTSLFGNKRPPKAKIPMRNELFKLGVDPSILNESRSGIKSNYSTSTFSSCLIKEEVSFLTLLVKMNRIG